MDPIAGPYLSKVVSVMASAYKRHTYILVRTFFETLSGIDKFQVWEEPSFVVTTQADSLVSHSLGAVSSLLDKNLDYDVQKSNREQKIDLMVFNKSTNSLNSYVIKRGNGLYDSGTKKALFNDLLSCQLLLKSYGEAKGFRVSKTAAHIIFYYGKRSVPSPFSLVNSELDHHFNEKIVEKIEYVNEYFKKSLNDMTNNYKI